MAARASEACLAAVLRLAAHWFPSKNFAMLSGLGLFFGNLGAVFAQVPLRIAVEHFTWRQTITGSALIMIVMGVAAWLVVRNDPTERGFRSYAPDALRKQEKASEVSEDEARDLQDKVQKLTDKFIAELEKLLAEKEADILKV